MSDKNKKVEDMEKVSDEIVEETMREIYDELHAADEKEKREEKDKDDTQTYAPDDKELEALQEELDTASKEQDEDAEKEPEEDEEDFEVIHDDDISDHGDDSEEDCNAPGLEEDESGEDDEDYADAEDEEEDERLVKHRRKKKAMIAVLSIVGVLAAAYLGVSAYFFSHFYFYTEINGNDFSAKTVDQVEAFMEKQVQDYTLTLEESDGGKEQIAGEAIALKYVEGKELDELLEKQNPFLWVSALWNKPQIEAAVGVEYDSAKLDQQIANLTCMKPEEQVESVSAFPEFQQTEFVIKEEVVGTQIDAEKFTKAVGSAISGFKDTLDMSGSGCYIPPKFTTESPEVAAARDAMNSYLGANITYDFNPHTEVVDASVISQWITVDGDMNVTFNQDAVRAFIQSLAEKYDTYGRVRTMVTGYGNTVEVSGGNYGWLIDQEAEYAALTANIQNAETVTREPNYSRRAASHEGNDFGSTFVEIDLTNQHMWLFRDGQLVIESDIVTGNPNKGNATPQGTYSLAYKATNQVLRGKKLPDGTYEYESPVNYWMPFNGGIGLHDANWQSAFGGSRYLTYGSHGCVNLPPSVAPTVYSNIEAGTPVVCHY